MQNPATSPKDQTLKLKGCVTLQEIEALTQWSHGCRGRTLELKPYKITALTPNGVVQGCFPSSITFNVMFFADQFLVEQSEGQWWLAHLVIHYDHISRDAKDIAAAKLALGLDNDLTNS